MQPQQYVCKFIEAEVHHILKTESRKLNKAPIQTDFCLANGIIDIIMFTDLDNPSQPMFHPYYSPLPIIVFFTQLSDIARNADGTLTNISQLQFPLHRNYFQRTGIATNYLTIRPGEIQRCTHLIP